MPDIQDLPDVQLAMQGNAPLPNRDVVLHQSADNSEFLASYLTLPEALAKVFPGQTWPAAGLLPESPAASRYTVFQMDASNDRKAGASSPISALLTASLQGEGKQDLSRAVIAAVANGAPARDQILPALENWKDPASIAAPADLPENVAIAIRSSGSLQLGGTSQLGFNFNWLHEAWPGRLVGDVGLKVNAAHNVSLQLSLSGSFTAVVSRTAELGASSQPVPRLRLRVYKQKGAGFDFASRISVGEQAAPLPANAGDLVAAILGVQEGQLVQGARNVEALPASVAPSLGAAFESFSAFSSLSPALRRQLASTLGPVTCQADFNIAQANFAKLNALADSIYKKALAALDSKYRAALSYQYASTPESTALLDCSFDFTGAGIAAYRRALGGEFLFQDGTDVHIHQGVLTNGIQEQGTIELHLPFMKYREWTSRLAALSKAELTGDEQGRVLAYTVDASQQVAAANTYQSVLALSGSLLRRVPTASQPAAASSSQPDTAGFTLAFTDRRTLRPVQLTAALLPVLQAYGFDGQAGQCLASLAKQAPKEVATSLTLSIPGELAAAWLQSPLERELSFPATYARVSVAVQQAMRKWLPFVYFSDPSRYETPASAYPLLVYQCSRPFPGQGRTEFTYDVMDRESTAQARRVPLTIMAPQLTRVRQVLTDAGKAGLAKYYDPKRASAVISAVERDPRMMDSLLCADALFVDQLIRMGVHGRQFGDHAQSDPAGAVGNLMRFATALVKTFHVRLRRLYGGQEFLSFGSLLLIEATNALSAASGTAPTIRGVLTITAGNTTQTLTSNCGAGCPPASSPAATIQ
jgi:hypothetical protein